MAQRVVKRRGCLFVGHMDCQRLDRNDLLAAHNGSLFVRMDWLGHIRLRHSRRVAMKDHQSAPAELESVTAKLLPQSLYTRRANLTTVHSVEDYGALTAIAALTWDI